MSSVYYSDRVVRTILRGNRFQKLYNGTDRKKRLLSHWDIGALVELMNKNIKELNFPNIIEG